LLLFNVASFEGTAVFPIHSHVLVNRIAVYCHVEVCCQCIGQKLAADVEVLAAPSVAYTGEICFSDAAALSTAESSIGFEYKIASLAGSDPLLLLVKSYCTRGSPTAFAASRPVEFESQPASMGAPKACLVSLWKLLLRKRTHLRNLKR